MKEHLSVIGRCACEGRTWKMQTHLKVVSTFSSGLAEKSRRKGMTPHLRFMRCLTSCWSASIHPMSEHRSTPCKADGHPCKVSRRTICSPQQKQARQRHSKPGDMAQQPQHMLIATELRLIYVHNARNGIHAMHKHYLGSPALYLASH